MKTNSKQREALEAARDLILPQCNGGTAFARACGEVVNKIMSALAAPRKNCERFQTYDEAAEEYDRLVAAGVVEDGTWGEWLFALEEVAQGSEVRG